MKKKTVGRISMLVVLIMIISACSKKHDYTNIIPVDANSVIALDIKSMSNKAGLNDSENQDLKLRIIDAVKSGLSASALLHVEKILKEPSESGISIDDQMYIFSSPAFPSPVMVGKVTDAKKLRNTLNVMAAEQISEPVMDANGYNYAIIGGRTALIYNKDAFMITQKGNWLQQDVAGKVLRYENDSTIHQNPYYHKLSNRKGDIVFFFSPNNVSKNMLRQMGIAIPNDIMQKDFMVIGNLNFDKGKITTQAEIETDNEEFKASLEKQKAATGKINGNLLGEFPISSLAFLSANMNGGEIFSLLNEYPFFRKNFSVEQAAQVNELFNSFKGDVSVALLNVTMNSMPTFVAYAETDKNATVDALYEQKGALNLNRGQDILKLAPNEYVFRSGKMNVFYGVKNGQIYATNDELIYKGIGAKSDQSLKDARYASAIKGKKQYFVLDVEAIAQLPVVKMMVGFGNREISTIYDIASRFSYLEAFRESEEKYEMNLYFRDKDTNSLKQIIDLAKQYTGM